MYIHKEHSYVKNKKENNRILHKIGFFMKKNRIKHENNKKLGLNITWLHANFIVTKMYIRFYARFYITFDIINLHEILH